MKPLKKCGNIWCNCLTNACGLRDYIERAIVVYIYVTQAGAFEKPTYQIISCGCEINSNDKTLVKDSNSKNVRHATTSDVDIAEGIKELVIAQLNNKNGSIPVTYSDMDFVKTGWKLSTLPD